MEYSSKKPHKLLQRANFYILSGFISILTGITVLLYGSFNPATVSKPVVNVVEKQNPELLLPYSIQVKGVTKELTVIPGHFEKGEWDLSPKAAMFLTQSARPNQNGNTVIYGHNTENIFGPLRNAKKGDLIVVRTKDGKQYIYVATTIKVVAPTYVEILKPTKEAQLTIFTCSGLFDSQRLVVVGKRI